MKDLRQSDKDQIFNKVNETLLFIRDNNGTTHPAKMYGRLLDYPVIATTEGMQCEISWSLAQRMTEKPINIVQI